MIDNNTEVEIMNSEERGKQQKKHKKRLWIIISGVLGLACIIGLMVWLLNSFIPNQHKKKAIELLKEGKYEEADKHIRKSGHVREWFANEMLLEREYDAVIGIIDYTSPVEEQTRIIDGLVTFIYPLTEMGRNRSKIKDDNERKEIVRGMTEAWLNNGVYEVSMRFLEQLAREKCGDEDMQYDLYKRACQMKYGEEAVKLFLEDKDAETIRFGAYEQDNDLANGKETIEWRVLSRENLGANGITILLIADQALDVCPESENADLWLNSVFINSAFSEKEQKLLGDTVDERGQKSVINEMYKQYYDSTKKVFCITRSMLDQYFPEESDRRCRATDYVRYSRIIQEDSEGYCSWRAWNDEYSFDYVIESNGGSYKVSVSKEGLAKSGVRPALIVWFHCFSD